ncbi:hypothetical protein DFP72DRAFT_399787 [Ephemerocybe angulata]|uniref:Uncharacterized protein n=1 Tax=Ephemerocybe angulata TaxID=980116 RepID=A0A8H6HVF3_9AGAR|nr:hypothetical protein DFP72DRAFT_399787 [Tulosesus angulatus]
MQVRIFVHRLCVGSETRPAIIVILRSLIFAIALLVPPVAPFTEFHPVPVFSGSRETARCWHRMPALWMYVPFASVTLVQPSVADRLLPATCLTRGDLDTLSAVLENTDPQTRSVTLKVRGLSQLQGRWVLGRRASLSCTVVGDVLSNGGGGGPRPTPDEGHMGLTLVLMS